MLVSRARLLAATAILLLGVVPVTACGGQDAPESPGSEARREVRWQ